MATVKKKSSSDKYQQWYAKNKEKLALRRRERYQGDPEYRARNLEVSRKWRQKNKPWLKTQRPGRTYLQVSEFAEQVGCSIKNLQNMERKGMLPLTTDGKSRRKYNPKNVMLAQQLVTFRKDHHYTEPKYDERLNKLVTKIKTAWRKAV